MNTLSLFASEPLKVSGSRSLVGKVTSTVGVFGAGCRRTFWVANVWASKAMAAAKSPPISGLGAEAVLVAADRSSAIGWVARVYSIFESESVSLVILLCIVSGGPGHRVWVQVWGLEYGVWVD